MLTHHHPAHATTLEAIGQTPAVRLHRLVGPEHARVVVKLESFNPTGSYKDRMALAMIEQAEARGALRPGMTVVEYTGGSTGSSLAFVCAVKGYRVKIVCSDAFAQTKLDTIRAFGAELVLVPSDGGRITPDLVPRMIDEARRLAEAEDVYWTNQLYNRDGILGGDAIGRELLEQVDGPIDGVCAAVGTAAMLVGISRALQLAAQHTRVVALEPAASPILTRGWAGAHHVEGTGIGMVPPLLTEDDYDEAWAIDEGEAREFARRLAREEGLLAGPSSAMNVLGALRLARELGPERTVVTVAVDTGLKYVSGDLFGPTPSPEQGSIKRTSD
jgi:cysteine synthase